MCCVVYAAVCKAHNIACSFGFCYGYDCVLPQTKIKSTRGFTVTNNFGQCDGKWSLSCNGSLFFPSRSLVCNPLLCVTRFSVSLVSLFCFTVQCSLSVLYLLVVFIYRTIVMRRLFFVGVEYFAFQQYHHKRDFC